jgi:hypothetical protein
MSYTLGTILSSGFGENLEEVVVLSDNRVATKTFGGKPVVRRDIMPLADWQVLVGNQRIVIAAAAAAAAEETYPVNTMLRWKKDEENKRSAIVLKDGILQVKEVIMGRTTFDALSRCKQMFFSSLADWKATLPAGGTLTTEAGTDHSIKTKVETPITAATDAEYIQEIKKRFQVRSKLIKLPTDNYLRNSSFNALQAAAANLQEGLDGLKNLSTDTALKGDTIYSELRCIKYSAREIARTSKLAFDAQFRMMYGPKENQNKESYMFRNHYRQVLYAFLGDKKVEITSSDGLVGIAYDKKNGAFSKWVTPTVGNTFAELGIEMKANGKPRLLVRYRLKDIEL